MADGDSSGPYTVAAVVSLGQVVERTAKLEWEMERVGERLNGGAETFTRQDERLKAIEADLVMRKEHADRIKILETKLAPKWSSLLAIAAVVSGWIWVASRYPDPSRFESLQNEVQTLKIQQIELKRDVNDIQKQQVKIEEKIDRVLLKP